MSLKSVKYVVFFNMGSYGTHSHHCIVAPLFLKRVKGLKCKTVLFFFGSINLNKEAAEKNVVH